MKLDSSATLIVIKATHTVVWLFFVICIAGVPIASSRGEFRAAGWLTSIVALEVLVLAINGWSCPLTPVAARYTDDGRPNFDIYLPEWLARNNKLLFGGLYLAGIVYTLVLWARS